MYREYYKFGSSGWDFGLTKNVPARFDTSDLSHSISVIDLPSGGSVGWGVTLLPASRSGDGYTYIYGVANDHSTSPPTKYEHIARVVGKDLSNASAWQYLTARRD